jgi:hypothetical protein
VGLRELQGAIEPLVPMAQQLSLELTTMRLNEGAKIAQELALEAATIIVKLAKRMN